LIHRIKQNKTLILCMDPYNNNLLISFNDMSCILQHRPSSLISWHLNEWWKFKFLNCCYRELRTIQNDQALPTLSLFQCNVKFGNILKFQIVEWCCFTYFNPIEMWGKKTLSAAPDFIFWHLKCFYWHCIETTLVWKELCHFGWSTTPDRSHLKN